MDTYDHIALYFIIPFCLLQIITWILQEMNALSGQSIQYFRVGRTYLHFTLLYGFMVFMSFAVLTWWMRNRATRAVLREMGRPLITATAIETRQQVLFDLIGDVDTINAVLARQEIPHLQRGVVIKLYHRFCTENGEWEHLFDDIKLESNSR
jgi:hypothetical protein